MKRQQARSKQAPMTLYALCTGEDYTDVDSFFNTKREALEAYKLHRGSRWPTVYLAKVIYTREA